MNRLLPAIPAFFLSPLAAYRVTKSLKDTLIFRVPGFVHALWHIFR
jgi:hypothetical protein